MSSSPQLEQEVKKNTMEIQLEEVEQQEQEAPRELVVVPVEAGELCLFTKNVYLQHIGLTVGIAFLLGMMFTKKGWDRFLDPNFYASKLFSSIENVSE
jgi:hypothetical protein